VVAKGAPEAASAAALRHLLAERCQAPGH
jgi:hypothetical protein